MANPRSTINTTTDTSAADADNEDGGLQRVTTTHRRLRKLFHLFKKTDELDTAIYDIVDLLLQTSPVEEENQIDDVEIESMIKNLPRIDTFFKPKFFARKPFSFHILRLTLDLYKTMPFNDDQVTEVFISEEEASDTDLYELIWFVRIRGAPAHDVRFMLDKYQSERDNAQASLATPRREIENPILRNTPVPPQEQRTIIQDPRSAYIPIENSTGTNARLETQPTLNIQASRIQSNDVRVNPNTGYIMSSSGSSFPQGTQSNVPTHLRGSNTSPDPNYIQSKKGHAVESYFRDSKFNGSPEQSIENLIRDFQICAEQQYLSAPQMSLFFVNTLADPARQFFLTHCSPHMPFEQIATQMRRHYNSESKKLQLQSEMDSLDLTTFMHKHQLVDFGTGLTKLVDYINALAPQLPTGFGDDPHKTRYLRRAVMSLDWAQQPISQVTTARYTFVQFITALQESLQLQEEISRAQATGINYGQYVNNPRDIGTRRNNRFSHLRNRQGNHWNRSRSP